jgi:hypothetical protein
MRFVLERSKEDDGLKLRPNKKCLFGIHDMEYLGYTVTGGNNSVSTHKVKLVEDWLVPTTQRSQHHAFLDLLRQVHPSL